LRPKIEVSEHWKAGKKSLHPFRWRDRLILGGFYARAEHQKLLNDERDAEAALKNLRDRTPSDLLAARAEDLSRLGGYVVTASFKVRMHVAACPECRKEDDSTAG